MRQPKANLTDTFMKLRGAIVKASACFSQEKARSSLKRALVEANFRADFRRRS